ncbi:MAG TPA: hypothetical protein VGL71_07400 [Urbifossiella sp.]|jgi:hypothetical protein
MMVPNVILGMAIGMSILGIYSVILGKMPVARDGVVLGMRARLLGLLCLLPFPCMAAFEKLVTVIFASSKPDMFIKDHEEILVSIESGIAIGLILTVCYYCWIFSNPPNEK